MPVAGPKVKDLACGLRPEYAAPMPPIHLTPVEAEALKKLRAAAKAGKVVPAAQTATPEDRMVIEKLLDIVGHPEAWVSDESRMGDFLLVRSFAGPRADREYHDILYAMCLAFKKPFDKSHLKMDFKDLVRYIREP